MASNSPFLLEDQADEDFFDKLVDDDDQGGGVGEESNSEGVSGLGKENGLVDGYADEEVNKIANLSISEVDHGNVGPETNDFEGRDGNFGGFSSVVEEREEQVCDGEVTSSLVSSGSFCFDNGQMVEDEVGDCRGETGLMRESSGGVKEVQWSAFADSSDLGSGGFESYDDFLTDFGQGAVGHVQSEANAVFGNETITNVATENVYDYTQVTEQIANGVDTNTAEYYESQYPGWKFDPNTGQWYEVDNTFGNATEQPSLETSGVNSQGNVSMSGEGQWGVSDVNSSQVFYSQQNVHNTVGSVSQVSTSENVSDWNHTVNQTGEYQYPAHMIFDPQYPGWYYDTVAQEWRSLDTYHSSIQSAELMHNQHGQNGLSGAFHPHGDNGQGITSNGLQVSGSEGLNANQTSATSSGLYNQQVSNDGQSTFGMNGGSTVGYSEGQSWPSFDSNVYSNAHLNPQKFPDSRDNTPSYKETSQNLNRGNWDGSAGNVFQPFSHTPQQNGAVQYSTEFYSNQNSAKVSQPFSNGHQVSYAPTESRTLTGRPPHALVTFGFGGKLLVMKDTSSAGFSLQGSKDAGGHSLSVLNLMEVVGANRSPLGTEVCGSSYFQSLCHQSFPGPLVGGSAGSKELNRWIDERIANCETMSGNDGKGEGPKLLLSLLKVACQHYGKLRSFGADAGQKDNDLPESAVASLFASAKRNSEKFSQSSALAKCLMTLPSEAQIQATASAVQNLLISGRKREALQCAQEGQFWEFALILSRELGDQFYTDTVKQMAVSQLVAGSPLRTLCLLIAKKPEEVFSNTVIPAGNLLHAPAMSSQTSQSAGYSMLANWEENLAVITANRTEHDHLVITHLGDSLWKERNDVIAAHICYLIAEADFELYSDTSRLCLIGADHWNFPRTYASPEAIQRTELFEYAKVTGNSQFVLLPLQPYKLIYAHMLAEIGRVSDSLKYCQAVHKVLKTGRSPEVDMSKQLLSSLEDRIRTHQQSGYAANLAPGKIVGKLLNLFDSTAHRVVGGLPPPAPSTTMSNGHHYQSSGSKVRSSQSTMGMSSLMPSASTEPMNERVGDGSKKTFHNRSVSEPNIGRTPRAEQVDTSNEPTSSSSDGKSSGSAGTSRFSRFSFGASLFQKTVGLVLRPRQGRQAKLGDTNKFYYDEKLKRWVEEGAEPPAEEPALAPPPTSTAFQAEKSDSYSKNAFNNALNSSGCSEHANSTPPGSSMEIPAFPPSSNQFSARGRMGVRSRYVDTFNKGGGASTNMFQAPSIPSSQPASLSSAKFFIPTASSQNQSTFGTESPKGNDVSESEEQKSLMIGKDPFQNLTQSSGTLHRFPSVDNISRSGIRSGNSSSGGPQSRRTASWSAIPSDAYTSPPTAEVKPSPLSFMPSNQSSGSLHNRGGSFGDDLHEVQL
ncbi:protein transport protein SEC16A homolog [Silene latifolia]|uniref:protein transport protein SEC16A homolog n=1 Tax=Silene latifolia TaxID=37657 RepID=UPI003D77F4EF